METLPPGARILVVDDSEVIRTLVVMTLKELGFSNIEEAADGLDASVMLEQGVDSESPYDVVISDITMPNMSGIELLQFCKDQKSLQEIPFLVISAESSVDLSPKLLK